VRRVGGGERGTGRLGDGETGERGRIGRINC